MKVIYDARHISRPFTGLGRYSASMLLALLGGHDRAGLEVAVLLHEGHDWSENPHFEALAKAEAAHRCTLHYVKGAPFSLSQHWSISRWVNAQGADHYFYPHFDVPAGVRTPFTFVVHDLIPLLVDGYVQRFPRLKRAYFRQMIRRSLMVCEGCVTVSKTTAQDVARQFGEAGRGKIRTAYLAPFAVTKAARRPLGNEAAKQPYLLYVGDRRPHKNLTRIVEIFETLHTVHGYTGRLVLAGSPHDFTFDFSDFLDGRDGVEVLGNVSDSDLEHLYRHADALLLLSEYEGFGLPVIEAAQHGCKVVVSDGGALPEIAPEGSCVVPAAKPVDRAAAQISTYLASREAPDPSAVSARHSWDTAAREIFPFAFA